MVDLLVIGEINPDLVLSGQDMVPAFNQTEKMIDGLHFTIGSSSVITACGAVKLGLSVAFIGVVGDDHFGHFMLGAMQERGIDTTHCLVDGTTHTGLSVIFSQPEDRAILTYPGTIPLLRPDQIDTSLFEQARHLHVGSYFLLDALRPALPELFSEAKRDGLSISLDTNWDPSGAWDVKLILPTIDLFFPNRNEVGHITGKAVFSEGLDALAEQVTTLAIKMGAEGGQASQNGETVTARSLPVEVVDTTGAGDSFNAGFLFGYLHGYSLQETLKLACACGSLSTRATGGTAAQPTLAEAEKALAQFEEQ